MVAVGPWLAEYRVDHWPSSVAWRAFRYTISESENGKLHYFFTMSGAEVGFELGMAMLFVKTMRTEEQHIDPSLQDDTHLYRVRNTHTGQIILL